MRLRLPQYSGKDYLVLSVIILPFTVMLNVVIFGSRLFTDGVFFSLATLITGVILAAEFMLCGSIAVLLKKRFPAEDQTWTRLGLMIFMFLLMTGLMLLLLFRGYESTGFYSYSFNETGFTWSYVTIGIANIFLTFLHEGIARYQNWKTSMKETEALKKVYRQSRLLCLKNQVNPHFLFNNLNTLSSLIHESEGQGEAFLDEMSKFYRYMLHNDEEALVTLDTELKFIHSYLYLLKTRHNEGLDIQLDIAEEEKEKVLPPLTLQTIIDYIVAQNMVCRDCPLQIHIYTDADGGLVVRNNVMPRINTAENQETEETIAGIDNLVSKYFLLNQPDLQIETSNREHMIRLSLIAEKEEVWV